jgi:uncharacterized damage-inducible protein DinB
MVDLKYPIGGFKIQEVYTQEELDEILREIENAPKQYSQLVLNLTDEHLEKHYREGSWTVRQLVHHVADIQFLHFFRMKKAVTESNYDQLTMINMDGWAATADAVAAPVADSLEILEGTTRRYLRLARSLNEQQLSVSYLHPVRQITFNQKQALAISAWHLNHHLAHIKLALGVNLEE